MYLAELMKSAEGMNIHFDIKGVQYGSKMISERPSSELPTKLSSEGNTFTADTALKEYRERRGSARSDVADIGEERSK
jgi:hypothetical protein